MTVVCVNFFYKVVWEKMLDLVYDSSSIMIRICTDQMMANIVLPHQGSALKNIILII